MLVRHHGLQRSQAALADRVGGPGRRAVRAGGAAAWAEDCLSFVYKAAAEIGELGDNTRAIRAAIQRRRAAAARAERAARPRSSCSATPAGRASASSPRPTPTPRCEEIDRGAGPYVAAALNGDVDNFADLKATHGLRIRSEITTDAKVIPTLTSRLLAEGLPLAEAFRRAVVQMDGSVAIAALAAPSRRSCCGAAGQWPGPLRGLGEDLTMVASEPYGLVEVTERYLRLDHDLAALVEGAKLNKYATGDVLFNEGDAPDGLYLIRRGSVTTIERRVGNKHLVLAYVAAGNYVGEMSLVAEVPRMATVRAASCRRGDRARRRALQACDGETSRHCRNRCRAVPRSHQGQRDLGSAGRARQRDLLPHGAGHRRGDRRPADRRKLCVGCDNCEKACADTHEGLSRLNREAGQTFAHLHVPTSCRHCEHPHCMADCPPNAIHRGPDGEVFIDDTCIGCGNCQRNCPYGVIQMAPPMRSANARGCGRGC